MMKRLIIVALVVTSIVASNAETNIQDNVFTVVSNALKTLKQEANDKYLWTFEYDILGFEIGFSEKPPYQKFTRAITNDWQNIVTNINLITTNCVDRILILGTGKQGDEALYLAYLETLTRMRINNEITERDLSAFDASTRYDLQSVLIRRYREPAISNLVEQLKTAWPSLSNHWNSILSGERYLKYLDEAAARQWGDNPPM